MSLFGAPGNAQPASSAPSLFGQASASAAPGTSLFGSAAAQPAKTSAAQGGGLFGALGGQPQSQAASGASLFGQTTSATAGSSLFGGILGGAAPSSTSAPPAAPLSGSTLGVGTSTSKGLFGSALSQAPAASQSQTQHSLFGQSGANGTVTQQQGREVVDRKENRTPNAALFEDLLERGKKRRDHHGNSTLQGEQLPSLQLGLGDISTKLRNIGQKPQSLATGRPRDNRAEYLLAASGLQRGTTQKDLDDFSRTSGVPPSQPAAFDPDIDAYVNNLHAKTTMEMMNESMEQSKRDFDQFVEDHIQINWEEQRRRIYEHFGLAKPTSDAENQVESSFGQGPRGAFGKSSRRTRELGGSERASAAPSFRGSGLSKSILGGSIARATSRTSLFSDVAEKPVTNGLVSAPDDPFQRTKQEKYAAKVQELNVSRLQEHTYPVIEQFAQVELQGGGDTPKHLTDAYKALQFITRERSDVQSPADTGAVKPRQFRNEYLHETATSGPSISIRRRILDGSRKFLEESFFTQIEDLIKRDPQVANVGGIPDDISKVRGYVRIRSARKDLGADTYELQMLGDDYCWVLIFYLLRGGRVQEAADYVAKNERAIKSMDRHFPQYMASYARSEDHRLPKDQQSRMNTEYLQRSRLAPENSIDPYRMGCYKIVGRCELSRKNIEGINAGIDDLIWLYFALARESSRTDETASEVFGLAEVKQIIEDIGQRHFMSGNDGGPGYATYFLMLMLSGMFEQAVAWLYPHNYVAAVHFAIALDFYGLLRISDFSVSENDLLTYTTRQKPQISFGRLIGYYTRDFRLSRAVAAADYLVLICLNADLPGESGRSQAAVCHEALKELVLETREFSSLLGDLRFDGRRMPGVIEQRLGLLHISKGEEQNWLQNLTVQAAGAADDGGKTTDAVLLYHLAEDYDSVVKIINRALSDALAVELGQDEMRLNPLKPRMKPGDAPQPQPEANDTLSLTSVDDPVTLARSMINLYNANALYFGRIGPQTRDACGILIRMSEIRERVTQSRWSEAIDLARALNILPMTARGDVSVIRSAAATLNSLELVVARNVGNLLLWTITACGQQRRILKDSAWQSGSTTAEELAGAARDLMVFAGLVRYRLPPDVFEVLARAGQDMEL